MPAKKAPTTETAKPTKHTTKPAIQLADKFNEKAEKPMYAGHIMPANKRREKLKGKTFIITSAQNNPEVHPGFLKALETYAKANDAQLMVSRFTYNKGAYLNDDTKGEIWYDPKIAKYLFDEPAEFTKKLVLGGEIDISPTATNPLSGFDNYFQGASGIVPHAKVALKSLPGLAEGTTRFLYSTGAITQRNYIQKKAGQKAEFHHNFSALVVEVDDDGNWFVRQLAADSKGMFQDLTTKYTPDGKVLKDQPVEAVNLGDIHVEKTDPLMDEVSFGKKGIMDTLKPKYVFLHDLMDFTARNHHNMKDPFFWADQHQKGATVEGGFDLVAAWLKAHERKGTENVIVESNHDEAFGRWLREADARFDPANARFWHEASAMVLREIEKGNPDPNVFETILRQKAELHSTRFMRDGDSFVIAKDEDGRGIETAMHGHTGPNGARGSPNAYRAMDMKANTGHTHSAGIVDGVYTAGVSGKLNMGYNVGPSSWSHSHIITYPNGKRAIITVKDGKWHAESEKHKVPAAKAEAKAKADAKAKKKEKALAHG